MTPTGRAVGAELIGKYGPRLIQAYLPYDLPDACARFLAHFRPRVGLLMETEIWPNLIASARSHNTPMLLVNARLSAKSQHGYQRFLPLVRPALNALSAIAAQTAADGERLQTIGASDVHISGNLKFDVTPSPEKLALGGDWRQTLGSVITSYSIHYTKLYEVSASAIRSLECGVGRVCSQSVSNSS